MKKLQIILNVLFLIMFTILLLNNKNYNKLHTQVAEAFKAQSEANVLFTKTLKALSDFDGQVNKNLKTQSEFNNSVNKINETIFKILSNK